MNQPNAYHEIPRTPEAIAACNGVDLAWDSFGDANDAPLLLIAGLGCQMVMWDDEFCLALASRGYRVIRYDNRDVGRSTRFQAAGAPDIPALVMRRLMGMEVTVPYTLDAMADDAAALLGKLGIPAAHVVGVSMGGAIAQVLALRQPQRVLSLTSIMSTDGGPNLPPPTPDAMSVLNAPAPATPTEFCTHYLNVMRTLRVTRSAADEAADLTRARRMFLRGIDPRGTSRQLAAMLAAPSRREILATLRVPSLVIHGQLDPLIPVAAGIATANAIPGARLQVIEAMGHTLPIAIWPELIASIANHAQPLKRSSP